MQEPKCEWNELEQIFSRTLSALWGNQLEKIKDRAERQVGQRNSGEPRCTCSREVAPTSPK